MSKSALEQLLNFLAEDMISGVSDEEIAAARAELRALQDAALAIRGLVAFPVRVCREPHKVFGLERDGSWYLIELGDDGDSKRCLIGPSVNGLPVLTEEARRAIEAHP